MKTSVLPERFRRRAIVGLLLFCAGIAPSTAARTVRVGLYDSAPIAARGADGAPSGFGVEILQYIAEREQWDVQWIDGGWAESLARLRQGEIDLLFPIARTDERLRQLDFSQEGLYSTWGRIFSARGAPVESVFDLDGRTVALVQGSVFSDELRKMVEPFDVACTFVELGNADEVGRAVSEGRAHAAALEDRSGAGRAARHDLEPTPIVYSPLASRFAVRAGANPDLLAALDRHLLHLKADSTSLYYSAEQEWLSSRPDRVWPRWLGVLLAVGGVLLVLFVGFTTVLRSKVRARAAELISRNEQLEREIAERQRSEQERTDLEEQLRHAQRMEAMGTMAAGVAHEFNNLLMVISGHAALLKEDLPEDHSLAESLTIMQTAVEQATEFTRTLLTFSRSVPVYRSPVDVSQIVQSTARMLERTLPASIEMQIIDGAGFDPWVRADESQLQQCLLNLAVNARDSMPQGGRLTIEVRIAESPGGPGERDDPPAQGVVRIVVRDTGTGMSEDVRSRIFEPFFSTKSHGQGTGLGLAFVHGVVKEYGGSVRVRSRPGEGTSFFIELPRVEPSTSVSGEEKPRSAAAGRGETVLVAEDQQQVREVLASFLDSLGYAVVQVGDGQKLEEQARSLGERIRLLILDVDLPKKNGLELLQELRAEGVVTPAIVMTGGVGVQIDREDRNSVMLAKPFRLVELGTLVSRMIEAGSKVGPS